MNKPMDKPNGIVHSFQDSLERSLRLEEEADWVAFYKSLWPDLLTIVRADKFCEVQTRGIDRLIWLPNDKKILIDEKRRDKWYGDILLETTSVGSLNGNVYTPRDGCPGWTIDPKKQCDYITYAIPIARKAFLIPYELLRITTCINLDAWKKWKGDGVQWPRYAPNDGYWTENIAVQFPILIAAMEKQMERTFGSSQRLPPPTVDLSRGSQLEFGWD